VLILLPPSEGKATATRGNPVDPASLVLPELTGAREEVTAALVSLVGGDRAAARSVLGISEGQDGELDVDARVRTAPAMAASKLYTGVLYEALGLSTLDAAAKRRANARLLVFSGLWGVVRPGDRIPQYRLSMGVRLPGVGGLAAFWRGRMSGALTAYADGHVVLDLRSSTYTGAWKPPATVLRDPAPVVTVRVLHERAVDGEVRRTVVSHFNKATKGRLVRDLLIAGANPKKPAELLDAMRDLGYTVEGEGPGQADVVVSEL
jgi:hypothetical protein